MTKVPDNVASIKIAIQDNDLERTLQILPTIDLPTYHEDIIHVACISRQTDILEHLLLECNIQTNMLHVFRTLASNNHHHCFKLFYEHGLFKKEYLHHTFLWSITGDNTQVIDYLIQQGETLPINSENSYNYFMMALKNNQYDMALNFLNHGCSYDNLLDPDSEDRNSLTIEQADFIMPHIESKHMKDKLEKILLINNLHTTQKTKIKV